MVDWDIPRAPTSALVLVEVAAERGVPPEESLRGSSLTPAHLHSAKAEVTARQEQSVIDNVLSALGNPPGLGVEVGRRYHLSTYGIFGFALISSPTLRSAIDVGLRYLDLTFALTRIRGREGAVAYDMVLDAPDVPVRMQRFAIERDAASIRVIQRELFAAPIPLQHISFTFPAPPDVAPYVDALGVEPTFGAAENVLAFPVEILDLPLPQANQHTAAMLQAQCRDLLDRLHARTGLSGQVRDVLLRNPSAPPNAEQVARLLNMSSRTLRHRLAGEGTSFRELLEEFRQRLAEEMLTTGGLTVAETAQRLGYVELSSFSQAFRRWNGMGPRAFRAAALGAHG